MKVFRYGLILIGLLETAFAHGLEYHSETRPDSVPRVRLVVLLVSDAGAYINGENILMDSSLNA
jgi:hypothetical protein